MVLQLGLSEEPKIIGTTNKDIITTTTLKVANQWNEEDDDNENDDDLSSISEGSFSDKDLTPSIDSGFSGGLGNVVVKNSSDVQFGNNTYYQGPVTIKQFVYKNGESGGVDNPLFLTKSDNCEAEENIHVNNIDNSVSQKNVANIGNEDRKKSRVAGLPWLRYLQHRWCVIALCLTTLLIISAALLIVLLTKKQHLSNRPLLVDSPEQENNTPIEPLKDPNVNVTLSGKLKIIPRLEWLAQPPVKDPTPLHHPVPYVIILHTATENCSEQATCTYHVRVIQTFHIESRSWWDIGYNFLVGGDGFAYEGRGWAAEGAHVYGYNSKSIGIAFIGTFNTIDPPARQLLAARQLIELGIKKNYIAPDYKLLAHRQLAPTLSPGDKLYKIIQTWPHWSPKP